MKSVSLRRHHVMGNAMLGDSTLKNDRNTTTSANCSSSSSSTLSKPPITPSSIGNVRFDPHSPADFSEIQLPTSRYVVKASENL